MIRSAVLRLTLAYLAILMTVSLGFSYLLYHVSANELSRELNQPSLYELIQHNILMDFDRLRNARLDEALSHLLANLAILNLGTLVVGSILSYGLAKRNIQPIEDALQAQSRFTADASHELRTPLTALQTEIEVSLRDKKLTLKEAREQLASNLEEVIKLKTLSDRLLRLARDDQEIYLKKVNYKLVIKKATAQVEPLSSAKKISIDNQAKDLFVSANQQLLEDSLVILLDNAIKYSNPKSKVVITTNKQGNLGYLSVTDQGQGIHKKDLPHIFERFYRSDQARSKEHVTGYGLGLSIADKMVREQKGIIDAKSSFGKGSTFTIKLPLAHK